MGDIEVLSRTQRIIVGPTPSSPVRVVDAGPIGPPGPPGPAAPGASAMGVQTIPTTLGILEHNLGFHPAGVRFFTLDGEDELEPAELTYVNENRLLASWPEPTAYTWMIS